MSKHTFSNNIMISME